MATIADLTAAVDAFMATPKRLVGHDTVPQWGPGFSPQEAEVKYPLEVQGELRGASLMVYADSPRIRRTPLPNGAIRILPNG
jgi:hypothetical protein